MGAYKFDRYLKDAAEFPTLLLEGDASPRETEAIISAIHLGRDLINTPAGDMGPEALHAAAQNLAGEYGVTAKAVVGDDLLAKNFPMIHAVGRAAHEAPRLVEFEWGDLNNPRLALVGKAVILMVTILLSVKSIAMRVMSAKLSRVPMAVCLRSTRMALIASTLMVTLTLLMSARA